MKGRAFGVDVRFCRVWHEALDFRGWVQGLSLVPQGARALQTASIETSSGTIETSLNRIVSQKS